MRIQQIYTEDTLEEALKLFKISYLTAMKPGESRSDFYCGITNSLERRKKEHKVDNNLKEIRCDSFETAKKLEQMLHDAGFDTGDQLGNGQENSVYVYMYKKINQVTNESLWQK